MGDPNHPADTPAPGAPAHTDHGPARLPEPHTGGRRSLVAVPARRLWRRGWRWYGEGPWQALLLALSFALAGYAGVRLLDAAADRWTLVLWFGGAALLHDLALVPLYGLVDRAVQAAVGAGAHARGDARRRARYLNHLRVPAVLSALLLLVYFPLVSGRRQEYYASTTGLSGTGFLGRWLLVTAVLFALSALWLLVDVVTDGRRRAARRRSATNGRPPAVH